MTWHFPHPQTGCPCKATYDGHVLEVSAEPFDDATARAYLGEDLFDELEADEELADEYGTEAILFDSGVGRTFCASEAAAIRELRAIGVEARFLA